jgi:hypothetical protein
VAALAAVQADTDEVLVPRQRGVERGRSAPRAAFAKHPSATPLENRHLRIYTYGVRITYDPAKRDWTLIHRGLDFEDAALVFDGLTAEVEDKRKDYGETRFICFGVLQNRLVVIGYTPRGAVRHVFSMRKANDREQTRFAPYFGL